MLAMRMPLSFEPDHFPSTALLSSYFEVRSKYFVAAALGDLIWGKEHKAILIQEIPNFGYAGLGLP